jgi:excisionase family DNA binding protein
VNLREAASRLGVHYQTAYRWVREGSLVAGKIGQSYEVSEQEVDRFLTERSEPAPPPRITHVRSWGIQSERLYRLLEEGDELSARALVDRLREGGVDPLTLCQELFAPALTRIGDDWEAGLLTVAHEHRASAICERLLARVAVHPRGRPRGVIVVCTPPGEEHGLPAIMAAIVLRADRWQVHHLGVQVPLNDLLDMVQAVKAQAVVFSLTQANVVATAERHAVAVRSLGARALIGRPGDTLGALRDAVRSG